MGESLRRIGGYEVVEKLGAGSVGTVYKARQVAMDRPVALKILNQNYANDPAFVERFVSEARTAGSISHANLCQVYEVGQDKGLYFFSMELVSGGTLDRLLRERGKLTVREATDIAKQVASALSAAHRAGLVHRDIKPGNILLSGDGNVKVVDLGLARAVAKADAEGDPHLVGTPYYMPPEQSSGAAVDIRGDIYSLGATFYHMLTGSPPFTGPHPTAVMVKHASEPLTPPSDVDPDVPRRISSVVEKMMAKSPWDRYPDPAELLDALERASQPRPASARTAFPSRVARGRAAPPARGGSGGGRARGARRPKTTKTSPIEVRKSGAGVAMPLALAGVVLVVGLVMALLLVGGEEEAGFGAAEADLARAEARLSEGTPASLDASARLALEVRKGLPAIPEAAPLIRRAERIQEEARRRKIESQERTLERLVLSMLDGERTPQEAAAVVARIRTECDAPGVAVAYRKRVLAACDEADEKITAFREKVARSSAPEPDEPAAARTSRRERPAGGPEETTSSPGEDSPTSLIVNQARAAAAEGSFADALGVIDVSVAAFDGEERRALLAEKRRLLAMAEEAFASLLAGVRESAANGEFAEAERELKEASGAFSFAEYPAKIEAELASLKEKALAAKETPPSRPIKGAQAIELVELPEEPDEPAPGASADDPEAVARKYLEKKGWTAEGGTFTMKDGVLTVESAPETRATITYKRKHVATAAVQFDARLVRGAGFRLQMRWSDERLRYLYSSRPGEGYALYVGAAEVKLQERGGSSYYWRRDDADEYHTWIRRSLAGGRWNRFAMQVLGDRITAAVNNSVPLARGDQDFQTGMIRFEFLEGTNAELRNLKIVTR